MHPEHGEGSSPLVSDFFDFNPALNRLNMSLVHFADLKTTDPALAEPEELAGYAAFADYVLKEGLQPYKVKTHFWPVPPALAYYPAMSTIELLGQRAPADWLDANAERIWAERELPVPPTPDEVVLTLDQTFYIREGRFEDGRVHFGESLEHVDPESFTWKEVGQHVLFQPWIERLADDFLAALYAHNHNHPEQTPVPAAPATGTFIGVHLRQGDFSLSGRQAGEGGLPTAFHEAVMDLQDELADRFADEQDGGGHIPVLFATDSNNPAWIRQVEEQYGWVYLNHGVWEREKEGEHAGWMASLLDSCILGRGIGLVGTHMSTFSSVAARRVESWQGGISRKVDPQAIKGAVPEDEEDDD